MTTMLDYTLSPAAWTEVASGAPDVLVSTNDRSGFVMVHVGAAAPALLSSAHLLCTWDRPVSLSGLVATDKVFARCHATTGSCVVVRT